VITGSTGTPSAAAAQVLWMYYLTVNTTVESARIRWAKRGIQYDQNSGVTALHTVQNSLFDNITGTGNSGIYVNLPSGPGLTLSSVQKCNVTTSVQIATGLVNGNMTDAPFCTDKQAFGLASDDEEIFGVGIPEDPFGAVSANRLVQIGNFGMAAYDTTVDPWVRIEAAGTTPFFGIQGSSADPRIIYDWQASRWVATVIDVGNTANRYNLRLAISKTSEPVPLSSETGISLT